MWRCRTVVNSHVRPRLVWNSVLVRATDDSGAELNAEFSVEPDGDHLALILESAGGRVAGSPHSRNHQYVPALTLLLGRLRDREAVLLGAFVDSQVVGLLPESERALVDAPVNLVDHSDLNALRLRLTRAQGLVGQRAGAPKEGNNRKRIRLRLSVPGHPSAADLEAYLAAGAGTEGHPVGPEASPDRVALASRAAGGPKLVAVDLLRSLIGATIHTVDGRPNRILEVRGGRALVATGRSPQGRPVNVSEVQAGLDLLVERRSVRVHPDELGYRSAFVGAVLSTLPGTVVSENPATITLHDRPTLTYPVDARFAVLDGKAEVKVRKEQAELRRMLVGARTRAACDLCGHEFPLEFLVAAHIKRRSVCSDDERNDLRNVAMLACKFGCDSLFESGYLAVDETGHIRAATLEEELGGVLREYLEELHGQGCRAHRPDSEVYFAWHRDNVYRT